MDDRGDLAALEGFAHALRELDVEFYIGGSVASSVHGVARTTIDIDLVADLKPAHIDPLVARLRDDYYVEREMIQSAVGDRGAFNVIHLATMYKVDVFVMKDRPLDAEARRRVIHEALEDGGEAYAIASPEDVILNKLEWFRAGGEVAERQWNDVMGVMLVQRDQLDRAYLRRWAAEIDVSDLLQRAWREADRE